MLPESGTATKRKPDATPGASGGGAHEPCPADVISPLSLATYDTFRKLLQRIPPNTPGRFQIISELITHNLHVIHSAAQYESVHTKLVIALGGADLLDRRNREVLDPLDYQAYAVVAIPGITICVHCDHDQLVRGDE